MIARPDPLLIDPLLIGLKIFGIDIFQILSYIVLHENSNVNNQIG